MTLPRFVPVGRASILLSILSLSAIGCSESRLSGVKPKMKLTIEQAKSTSSDVVDFGEIAVSDTAKRRVSIANDGGRALAISDVKLPKSKAYKVNSVPQSVGQGETAGFIVEFSPPDVAKFDDTITFKTDDPDKQEVTIKLSGRGTDPNMVLCAPPLDQTGDNCVGGKNSAGSRLIDFGPTIFKFKKRRAVSILAAGQSDVVVQGVSIVGAPEGVFTVDPVKEGTHVTAGSKLTLNVEFSPAAVEAYAAQLVVLSNDARQSKALVNLQGSGEQDCQTFRETKQHKGANSDRIDILFVIDTSGSMSGIQNQVKAKFETFVAELSKTKMNWHVGVTTTDLSSSTAGGPNRGNLVWPPSGTVNAPNGQRVPFVYSASLPSVGESFQVLMEQISDQGSGVEYGTLAAAAAMIPANQDVSTRVNYQASSGIASPFKGALHIDPSPPADPDNDPEEHLYFYRRNARLAVIIVSDENDGSDESLDGTPAETYVNFFKNIKADSTLTFKYIAITQPAPQSAKYHSIVNAFGADGKFLDINDDFEKTLQLAGGIVAVPQCLFDLDSGVLTIDENNNIIDDRGVVYGPGEWEYVPPTIDKPRGQVKIIGTRCPDEPTNFTIDFVSCLRSYDRDRDVIPDMEDNCADVLNPDQADANADGVGDMCVATP